ncbi:MAG: hypothetical protein Q9195_005157 [Heterodermia aff. obscurata]
MPPSETSPLIPKSRSTLPQPPPLNGTAPNGISGNRVDNKSVDEEEAYSDEEGRDRQYQGLPEVKKQLKYILPAVAIGVWIVFQARADVMLNLAGLSLLAGIGGGGMTTVVSILMSDIVTLRERGVWQGVINIIYAAGSGIGAPLGGVLADYIGWRWAFLGQVPLCALAFVVVGLVLKLPKTESSDWKTKLKRVDFLGAFVLVCAVFILLLGLDRGSNYSWKAPVTIVSLCVSFPLFFLFILVELKIASEPFAPGRIVFERSLFACYLCNFFSFAGWLAGIFYLPLYFQARDGLSGTQAGIRLLPGIVAGVSGSLFGGFVMKKTGKYYWLTVCAYTSLALGMVLILLCAGLVTNNTYGILVGIGICGWSNGIGVTTSLIGLIANAAQEDQAIAIACSYLFRSLGSVLGLSLSATVVQQSLRNQLQEKLRSGKDAANIVKGVRESLDYLKTLDPVTRNIVRQCYGHATTAGFGLMLGTLVFGALSSYLTVHLAASQRIEKSRRGAVRSGNFSRSPLTEKQK